MATVLKAVRLPEAMVGSIDAIAKALDRTESYIIKTAISKFLEDYADYEIALQRLNDPTDKIITIEEMEEAYEKNKL